MIYDYKKNKNFQTAFSQHLSCDANYPNVIVCDEIWKRNQEHETRKGFWNLIVTLYLSRMRIHQLIIYQPFGCWNMNIVRELGQYTSCWCPGALCHHGISNHDTEYAGLAGLSVLWGRISTICAISVFKKYNKCKYIFVFYKMNSNTKRLYGLIFIVWMEMRFILALVLDNNKHVKTWQIWECMTSCLFG